MKFIVERDGERIMRFHPCCGTLTELGNLCTFVCIISSPGSENPPSSLAIPSNWWPTHTKSVGSPLSTLSLIGATRLFSRSCCMAWEKWPTPGIITWVAVPISSPVSITLHKMISKWCEVKLQIYLALCPVRRRPARTDPILAIPVFTITIFVAIDRAQKLQNSFGTWNDVQARVIDSNSLEKYVCQYNTWTIALKQTWRRATASALKADSALWWLFVPRNTSTCNPILELVAIESSTWGIISVDKSPIFSLLYKMSNKTAAQSHALKKDAIRSNKDKYTEMISQVIWGGTVPCES